MEVAVHGEHEGEHRRPHGACGAQVVGGLRRREGEARANRRQALSSQEAARSRERESGADHSSRPERSTGHVQRTTSTATHPKHRVAHLQLARAIRRRLLQTGSSVFHRIHAKRNRN